MRVLGIDPGLAIVGIGTVDVSETRTINNSDWMTIETNPGPLSMRLREIHDDLSTCILETRPELAVVERLYFAANERTAMDVAHARGVILLTLEEHGIPILEPTPLQLKSGITGDGKADKTQMQQMLVQMLSLSDIPKPDDAADALALAVYGALHANAALMAS